MRGIRVSRVIKLLLGLFKLILGSFKLLLGLFKLLLGLLGSLHRQCLLDIVPRGA